MLLERFEMENRGSADISMLPPHTVFTEDSVAPRSNLKTRYHISIVGSLYLSTRSRPYISLAVEKTGRKSSRPTIGDWNRLKRVFKYLKETTVLGLHIEFGKGTTAPVNIG